MKAFTMFAPRFSSSSLSALLLSAVCRSRLSTWSVALASPSTSRRGFGRTRRSSVPSSRLAPPGMRSADRGRLFAVSVVVFEEGGDCLALSSSSATTVSYSCTSYPPAGTGRASVTVRHVPGGEYYLAECRRDAPRLLHYGHGREQRGTGCRGERREVVHGSWVVKLVTAAPTSHDRRSVPFPWVVPFTFWFGLALVLGFVALTLNEVRQDHGKLRPAGGVRRRRAGARIRAADAGTAASRVASAVRYVERHVGTPKSGPVRSQVLPYCSDSFPCSSQNRRWGTTERRGDYPQGGHQSSPTFRRRVPLARLVLARSSSRLPRINTSCMDCPEVRERTAAVPGSVEVSLTSTAGRLRRGEPWNGFECVLDVRRGDPEGKGTAVDFRLRATSYPMGSNRGEEGFSRPCSPDRSRWRARPTMFSRSKLRESLGTDRLGTPVRWSRPRVRLYLPCPWEPSW